MKCPHCKKEIGFPPPSTTRVQTCVYCQNKITYGFNGLRVAHLSIPAAIVCWLVYPYFPQIIIVLFLAIVLLPAIQIDKTL